MKKRTLLTVILSLGMSIAGFAQSWDFEDGTGDWYVIPGTLQLSSDVAFSGSSSVKIISAASSNQVEFGLEAYKNATFTDTLKFQLYVDATNLANLNGVQVFYKQGTGWTWNATWIGAGELVADTWNELAFVVAEDLGTVQSMGLLVDETTPENVTTFYVDGVEVAPFVEPVVEEDREVVTFDFDSGIDAWSVAGGTAETSSDFFLSGITSVKLTSAGDADATDFATTSHLNIEPGDTLSFWVWAEDLSAINGLQLFAKNGYAFDWSATWTDAGDLFAGQWNKVSHVVPDGFGDVREWGVQLATLTATDTPTIYLENASIAPYVFKEVVVTDPVFTTWDFYEGWMDDWQIADGNGQADSTSIESYSGPFSVKLTKNLGTDRIEFVRYSPPAFATYQTVEFNVWVPLDTTNIAGISPYVQFDKNSGDDNEWDGYANNWNAITDLIPGNWNTVSITIPDHLSLQSIGLQVLAFSTAPIEPVLVDFITSDSTAATYASLYTVDNVKTDSLSQTYLSLSWSPPLGRGLDYYLIKRLRTGTMFGETIIDTVTTNFYNDSTIQSASHYVYTITPIDTLGRTPRISKSFSINTPYFSEYTTWDFETGTEGWYDLTLDGIIKTSGEYSFSGLSSYKLETPENQPYNYIKNDSIAVEAGQIFTFHFYLPGDANGIAGFTGSSNVTGDTAFVYRDFSDFELGAWNTFEYQIPDYDSTSWVAFSVISSSTGTSPIYVDLISTDPNEEGIPTVLPPESATATTLGYSSIALAWSPAEGNGPATYSISAGRLLPYILRDYTGTEYVYEELINGTTYSFQINAVDPFGRYTEPVIVTATTEDFTSHATFDFEFGNMEGWSTSQGTAELTDEKSYSGVHSVKFTTGATESFFEFIDDTTDAPGTPTLGDIRLGHTITYRVWVSTEDTAKISLFQIWAKDGTWGWASNVVYPADLTPDAWTEMSFTIPEDYPNINSVGFQIIGKVPNENPDVTVFIDLISTEATPYIRPNLTVPTNVKLDDEQEGTVITWSKSIGNATLDGYNIYLKKIEPEAEFEFIGISDNEVYSIEKDDLNSTGTYQVSVTGVTDLGKETQKSVPFEFDIIISGVDDDGGLPKEFKLFNNYPNPFNPSTVISYQLPADSQVKLSVYNLTGQLVQTLVDEVKNAGSYEVNFNASTLASGMYIYRLEAGTFVQVHRMMLIK